MTRLNSFARASSIFLSWFILIHLVVSWNTKTGQTPVALTCRRKNKDACARMGWHDLEGRGRVHTRLKLPLCLTGLETARPALPRRSGVSHTTYEISCTQRSAFPKSTFQFRLCAKVHRSSLMFTRLTVNNKTLSYVQVDFGRISLIEALSIRIKFINLKNFLILGKGMMFYLSLD